MPPRSATAVGIAVATAVASSAARKRPATSAAVTSFRSRPGCKSRFRSSVAALYGGRRIMRVWYRAVKLIGLSGFKARRSLATAKSIDVILNPAAGGGAGQKHRSEIERELAACGVVCRVHETTGPGDASHRARALAQQGARVIAAAGGDGTMHEVANGILEDRKSTRLN